MKVIIAGSRNIKLHIGAMLEILRDSRFPLRELVYGGSEGIDKCGFDMQKFRMDNGSIGGIRAFYPDWKKHGKAAGPIRNKEMAEYADALILIWDGKSKGSANMKKCAEEKGLKIYEVIIP